MSKDPVHEYYYSGYMDGCNSRQRRSFPPHIPSNLVAEYELGYHEGLEDRLHVQEPPVYSQMSEEGSLANMYDSYPDLEEIEAAYEEEQAEKAAESLEQLERELAYVDYIEQGGFFRDRYARYRQSDHWKEVSAAARARAKNKCQRCGSTKQIEVHHRTYARLGAELPEDLEVLCRDCHRKVHNK